MTERPTQVLARQQLERRLDAIRQAGPLLEPPRKGWVSALRRALGMPQAYLAEVMGVSRQAVSQLERREAEGSITLRSLEQAAQALGGKLVYAVVPARPLSETLQARALELATGMVGDVRHTMRLEDQEPETDLDRRARDLAEQLLDSPSDLWPTHDVRGAAPRGDTHRRG